MFARLRLFAVGAVLVPALAPATAVAASAPARPAAVSAAFSGAASASAAASGPRSAASYGAGELLDSAPVSSAQLLPSAASGWNVVYSSTSYNGGGATVSGQVFVPAGTAPAGGWPVISWAHGTVGVAPQCGPTIAGRSARDVAYLDGWLSAGYAVAATDYQGLGTVADGPHPFLNGNAEAYDTIDIVRAAQGLGVSLSNRWMVVGQSQGGQAALYTAPVADSYAPDLDFRGTVATAPPTQWAELLNVAGLHNPAAPVNTFLPLIVAGLKATNPGTFNPADFLTPTGLQLVAKTSQDCIDAIGTDVAGLTLGQVLNEDPARLNALAALIETFDVPTGLDPEPVFIGQGTADTTVFPPASQQTANQLVASGTDVTFKFYPGATHNTLMAAALGDVVGFAGDQFSC
ncbi:alpha/beta hydrolase family protein [Catenulispora rubra]|uniref:alpha/beta hydrolase family protein n=1 Tax=Catenulispora rubra TaxID=280293 RepID=UPI0018921088|nr:lipase family protein [Catenulispora rubra]